MNYPDAPRFVPATPALLDGWTGVVQDTLGLSVVLLPGHALMFVKVLKAGGVCKRSIKDLSLDPMRPEVRDHLVRRLSLPGWMRDGAGLEPWQSAGLIACAAAGTASTMLYGSGVENSCTKKGPDGWRLKGRAYPAGFVTEALDQGCALMLDADTMVLPYPDGPKLWRRT